MKHYTLGLYEKAMPSDLSWNEKLQIAKSAGFDFVEISIDETDEKLSRLNMSGAERMALVNTFQVLGIPIRTMCLSGHRKYPLGSGDPAIAAKGMEIMEKAIQLADDLGIRIIQLAGYDVYYEESSEDTHKRFVENLIRSVELAAARSIVLGFETMETEFMNTVEKSMEYVGTVLSAYLNVYPDAGNLTNASVLYGRSVLDDIRAAKGRIVALHLKETKPGVFREVPFGSGHVDFQAVIDAAWETGARKFVIEMWAVDNEKWKEDIFTAQQMIQNLLNQIQNKYST